MSPPPVARMRRPGECSEARAYTQLVWPSSSASTSPSSSAHTRTCRRAAGAAPPRSQCSSSAQLSAAQLSSMQRSGAVQRSAAQRSAAHRSAAHCSEDGSALKVSLAQLSSAYWLSEPAAAAAAIAAAQSRGAPNATAAGLQELQELTGTDRNCRNRQELYRNWTGTEQELDRN